MSSFFIILFSIQFFFSQQPISFLFCLSGLTSLLSLPPETNSALFLFPASFSKIHASECHIWEETKTLATSAFILASLICW
jgi:hypothetical protein